MPTRSQAPSDSVAIQYRTKFFNDPDTCGEVLATQFAADYGGLKTQMSPLGAFVDALPDPRERSRRAVTIPKKGYAMDMLRQLAHAFGRSDRAFPELSRKELESTLNMGVAQRE